MKTLLIALLALGLGGCASWYTAKTTAKIPIVAENEMGQLVAIAVAEYESDKQQEDLDVEYNPKTGLIKVRVGKASTPEAAIIESGKATNAALGILGTVLKSAPVP